MHKSAFIRKWCGFRAGRAIINFGFVLKNLEIKHPASYNHLCGLAAIPLPSIKVVWWLIRLAGLGTIAELSGFLVIDPVGMISGRQQ